MYRSGWFSELTSLGSEDAFFLSILETLVLTWSMLGWKKNEEVVENAMVSTRV
jgi:hypothetical protein